MPPDVRVESGQELSFPVMETHPLAVQQSFRMPTSEEVEQHPFWSTVVKARTAQLQAVSRDMVISSIIRNIGWIVEYNLGDIFIAPGGVMTFLGTWHAVRANVVTISGASADLPRGQIRILCDDPTISASFTLICTELTGG